VPLDEQEIDDVRPDEAGAARYQHSAQRVSSAFSETAGTHLNRTAVTASERSVGLCGFCTGLPLRPSRRG
jgi:hypothetical protein